MKKTPKHLFFDLDDTVTLSRSRIDDDMHALMSSLPHDLIVISGAHIDQLGLQLLDLPTFRLGQNGNQAFHRDGSILWEERLTEAQERAIREHIEALKPHLTHSIKDENDLIEHRGSQISFSLLGHHEDVPKKKMFDPERALRLALLEKAPFEAVDVEVRIGGTTCFDYFMKGRHKGYNVAKLIAHMGWDRDECVYYGDALFPGGNDEAVIGVIETIPVKDHRDTYTHLSQL